MTRPAVVFGTAHELLRTSILGISVFAAMTALAKPVDAMGPNFCQNYARAAVAEFYRANSVPACGGPAGPRWHNNFQVHYDWCLQASYQDVQSEWNARRELLNSCGAGGGGGPVPQAGPYLGGSDTSCCPNSMLVCPAGRHFCR